MKPGRQSADVLARVLPPPPSTAQCFQQIIVSWSPSYRDFPNTLPESAGITSSQMISFLIFWLVQFPFLLIHPSRIRWFFLAKVRASLVTDGAASPAGR